MGAYRKTATEVAGNTHVAARAWASKQLGAPRQLFYRELLDQELREHIGEETRAVRNLILAHAFSKTDLVGR